MSLDLKLLYSDFNITVDKSNHHKIYEFENFRLDTAHLMLYRGAEEIPLAPKAVETLIALVERRGEILSKDDLLNTIWMDSIVEESNLSKYLHVLRKTLGNRQNGKPFIETLRRRGYRFNGEVSVGDALPEAKPKTSNQKFTPFSAPPDSGAIREATTGKIIALADWRHAPPEAEGKISEATGVAPQIKEVPAVKRKGLLPVGAAVGLLVLGLAVFLFFKFRSETPVKETPFKTIAVLPFKPLITEDRDEVLEIGMADTLITRLGNNREVVVMPLSSVRKYGNLEQNAAQAGRELGVDSVLDGSIQRLKDKIRVNVRLIKVADGSALWTGTFDEKFTDIFVVQDAISRKVESALALRLSGDEQTRLEKRDTNNVEAYEFYLRGRFYSFKITPPDTRTAIGFYQKAIDADPDYALAIAGMAEAYRIQAIAAHAPSKEVCPKAKALAMRALEIDNSLAEAHVVLGWIGFLYDLDWENAERELQKAVELAPNNSETHRAYAHLLSSAGRHDEALAEAQKARELAPLTLITAALESQFLLYAGQYDEAIIRSNKTLELDPNFWVAHVFLGRIYTIQERYDEAVSELTKAREFSGGSSEPIAQLGYALAKSGRREQAQAALEELKSASAKNYVPMYFIALIYNGLNEHEQALDYLEKALDEREVQMTFLKADSRWDNLRREPRFIDLMRRMSFS